MLGVGEGQAGSSGGSSGGSTSCSQQQAAAAAGPPGPHLKREAPISLVSHSCGTNCCREPSLQGGAPAASVTWNTGCVMRTMTVCGTRAKRSWSSR